MHHLVSRNVGQGGPPIELEKRTQKNGTHNDQLFIFASSTFGWPHRDWLTTTNRQSIDRLVHAKHIHTWKLRPSSYPPFRPYVSSRLIQLVPLNSCANSATLRRLFSSTISRWDTCFTHAHHRTRRRRDSGLLFVCLLVYLFVSLCYTRRRSSCARFSTRFGWCKRSNCFWPLQNACSELVRRGAHCIASGVRAVYNSHFLRLRFRAPWWCFAKYLRVRVHIPRE